MCVYVANTVYTRLLCSWSHRLIRWLRAAYPNRKIDIISYAAGSTTSLYGMPIVQEVVKELDLILMDYSCNDSGIIHGGLDMLLIATESIIRAAISNNVAILYISEHMSINSPAPETAYETICERYEVPHLAYRRAVWEKVKNNNQSIHWPTELSNVHAPWPTHQLITDLVTSYWMNITKWMCYENNKIKFNNDMIKSILSKRLSPAIYYNDSDTSNSLGLCSGSRLFSLLPEDLLRKNVSELVPFSDNVAGLHPGK